MYENEEKHAPIGLQLYRLNEKTILVNVVLQWIEVIVAYILMQYNTFIW